MMLVSRMKLAAAVLLLGCSAFAPSMIHGQSSRGENRPVAVSAEPAHGDGAKPKPEVDRPAIAPEPSPPGSAAPDARPAIPWQTAVRIKVVGDHQTGFASGTVIASSPEESIILTSAHQFLPEKPGRDVDLEGRIKVDLFGPREDRANPQLGFYATCDGALLDCDYRRDISLVRIRPGRRLPASKVVPPRWQPKAGMNMLAMGCSEGNDPSSWNVRITNPRVRGLADNADYEAIECAFAPKQGRTGGGLFTLDHRLAGVCDFAEPQQDHGLYASPDAIYLLLDRNNLSFLYDEPAVAEKELDDLLRVARRQLDKHDRAGADRTIERLDALIEERRKELQAALRALDTDYARRRDELLDRSPEERPESPREAEPRDPFSGPAAEPGTSPRADARLDRILEGWRRQMAALKSVDVRFTTRRHDARWGGDESGTGRVVLTSDGRAVAEFDQIVRGDHVRQRWIWTEDRIHWLRPQDRSHVVWPIAAEDRGRLPAHLALPFCWHLSEEGLKARYGIALTPNQHEGSWTLLFTPLTKAGRETFSQAYVELDRSTLLPRRYLVFDPDGKSTNDFRVTDTRCDQPIPEELWRIPDQGDSSRLAPFARFIKLDLIP